MDLNDDDARAKLLHQLMDNALAGTTNQICSSIDPSKLAIRELPPGTWAQLYLLYQSFCLANDLECAGQTTFYSATMPWRKALKFRAASKHSLCTTCDRLKSSMRHSKDVLQHAAAADELLGHLKLTWLDRRAYWQAREMSRSHQDTLCLIFDGFDKSKPVVPRWAHGQLPKNPTFERLNRTNIAISAILCHGYGAIIYMSEEGNVAGGTFCFFKLDLVGLKYLEVQYWLFTFKKLCDEFAVPLHRFSIQSKVGSACFIASKPADKKIAGLAEHQLGRFGASTTIRWRNWKIVLPELCWLPSSKRKSSTRRGLTCLVLDTHTRT